MSTDTTKENIKLDREESRNLCFATLLSEFGNAGFN